MNEPRSIIQTRLKSPREKLYCSLEPEAVRELRKLAMKDGDLVELDSIRLGESSPLFVHPNDIRSVEPY